jgi:hypothetical protein
MQRHSVRSPPPCRLLTCVARWRQEHEPRREVGAHIATSHVTSTLSVFPFLKHPPPCSCCMPPARSRRQYVRRRTCTLFSNLCGGSDILPPSPRSLTSAEPSKPLVQLDKKGIESARPLHQMFIRGNAETMRNGSWCTYALYHDIHAAIPW